jgi:8-oxo-dGTP diphosphatase
VFTPDRRQVLLVHRTARGPSDPHYGKYNGLGGKLEANEDVVSGMRREIREEAGLECESLHLAGTVSWPGFGKHGEDWFGFIFRITQFTGTPPEANDEGSLLWVDVSRVMQLPLWDGDRHFLPMVFDPAAAPFHGVMPYSAGRPVAWRYSSTTG